MQQKLLERPIIPVIVIDDAADAVPLAEALLAGGIDVIEVTFRTAAAADALTAIAKRFPDMLLGAGTVLGEDEARRAMDCGATFALAPGLNPEVVASYQAMGGLFIPGVMTPSEIERAMGLGCQLMKFFPAGAAGGVPFLKALAGPYANRGVRFCPTGGVSPDNMGDYLALPMVFAVGGSWIATAKQIADKDWDAITAQAKDALARAEAL